MDWVIAGGEALLNGRLARADVALSGGVLARDVPAGARRFDAAGLLVMPGLVDIHGDAHERQMQPRPGVGIPPAIAMRDSAAQLLACGITTALLGITLSWEPGLRGLHRRERRAPLGGCRSARPLPLRGRQPRRS